jgi:hypothetical protein
MKRHRQSYVQPRDRSFAIRTLMMQFRVERAARRMGRVGLLLLLPLTIIVMIAGIFVKRYM